MNKKIFYSLSLFTAILALLSLTVFCHIREQQSCAGVHILSEKEYLQLQGPVLTNAAQYLLQNGHPVAMDINTNTIYISLNSEIGLHAHRLTAQLSSSHPDYKLYFAPDEAFLNLENAISQNHVFTLLAVQNNKFTPFPVVFTTMPILELSGPILTERDALRRGSFTLWDPYSSKSGHYSISTSEAEWHTRGGLTKGAIKQSYKINLKKQGSAENRNLSVLSLGSDDDWILSPLYFDDLKIREQVVTDVWNSYQDTKESTLKMSNAEYVEVIMNGRYYGLYLIRRRIDNKYLGSSRAEDVIMEGSLFPFPSTVEEAYPIKFNPASIPSAQIYDLMSPHHQAMSSSTDVSSLPDINWDNWIDINILMDAFSLDDNRAYKNMFYILHKQNDRHILEFILWDVDMALGLKWDGKSDFVLDSAQMNRSVPFYRREAAAFFNLNPSLKNELARRWMDLRADLLSVRHLESIIHYYYNILTRSGSLLRDKDRWGIHYHGEDTLEALLHNLPVHLKNMDGYYQSILSESDLSSPNH